MDTKAKLVRLILDAHPDVQAVYLYGSSGTTHERPESDLDLALLLPPEQARQAGSNSLNSKVRGSGLPDDCPDAAATV